MNAKMLNCSKANIVSLDFLESVFIHSICLKGHHFPLREARRCREEINEYMDYDA